MDHELEAEASRHRSAGQGETSHPSQLDEWQDLKNNRERCLAERSADPLGDFWGDPADVAVDASPPIPLTPSKVADRAFAVWLRSLTSPAPAREPVMEAALITDGEGGIDDHGSVSYCYETMATNAQFDRFSGETGVPVPELRAFVSAWHKRAAEEATQHGQPPTPLVPAGPVNGWNGSPEDPSHNSSETPAASELAKVAALGDGTLLRQWHTYKELQTAVLLPKDGRFKTLEEARKGRNLVNTYTRARARQEKIGVEVVPENDEYISKVSTASTTFYQQAKPKAVALG